MAISIIDLVLDHCAPKMRIGTQYLKQQLSDNAVKIRLSHGCLQDLVRDAIVVASATRKPSGEPYFARLHRELDSRAQFVRQWTDSDQPFDSDRHANLVKIARRYALPRPWKPTIEPARVASGTYP